jgi:hypothetical protein
MGEKDRVAVAAREKVNGAARLPVVDLETERELAVARQELGLDFGGNRGNPALSKNVLRGLQPAMKTKQKGCKK